MLMHTMDKRSKGFTIAHINVRGLLNKIDQIRLLVNNYKFKILHVSETFLTKNTVSNLISIPDYNIVRRDRLGKHGGGLVSYVHSSVAYKILENLNNLLPETISLEISIPHSKPFLTLAIYRPPNSPTSWIEHFDKLINSSKSINNELIILGDFNINMNSLNRKWSNVLHQLNLSQLIQQSTRVSQYSKSLIDHIYVSNSSNII